MFRDAVVAKGDSYVFTDVARMLDVGATHRDAGFDGALFGVELAVYHHPLQVLAGVLASQVRHADQVAQADVALHAVSGRHLDEQVAGVHRDLRVRGVGDWRPRADLASRVAQHWVLLEAIQDLQVAIGVVPYSAHLLAGVSGGRVGLLFVRLGSDVLRAYFGGRLDGSGAGGHKAPVLVARRHLDFSGGVGHGDARGLLLLRLSLHLAEHAVIVRRVLVARLHVVLGSWGFLAALGKLGGNGGGTFNEIATVADDALASAAEPGGSGVMRHRPSLHAPEVEGIGADSRDGLVALDNAVQTTHQRLKVRRPGNGPVFSRGLERGGHQWAPAHVAVAAARTGHVAAACLHVGVRAHVHAVVRRNGVVVAHARVLV
ncbi:hypothetical protein BOVATA_000530 [Babesia ovata]|uniref:Uncharacterized protein n=1 Tax=Babesia ovata TaxID=189622 RepID=A0A2H6K6E5_9APIC|nr:uncharacterized protein BOVATA_000530 [Babesia ovata]GBE58560.1 hypothetical protein BOVATA_000530 [Babesia ovata]